MDLDAVAEELYGLRPEDFTAARNDRAAEARKAGDRGLAKRISGLRRPSLSAWAGNILVRERPDEIEPFLQLGEALRQAHRDLDGEQLRELSSRQRALVSALAQQARQLAAEAGHPISEDAQREVEETLHAVLADPRAAGEWATGQVTKPLSATTDFAAAAPDASARPTPASRPVKPSPARRRDTEADERRRGKLSEARRDAEDAEEELRAREEETAAAGRDAEDAAEAMNDLQRRVTELADELKSVEEEHREARTREREARGLVRKSERRAREARKRAAAAAERVERLTAQDDGGGGGGQGEE